MQDKLQKILDTITAFAIVLLILTCATNLVAMRRAAETMRAELDRVSEAAARFEADHTYAGSSEERLAGIARGQAALASQLRNLEQQFSIAASQGRLRDHASE